jgi:DNA polymerase sigma
LQFRDSVKEILTEMQPVKEQIIENITAVIKKAVPQSEVRVYGSHATKLCLPWSDIDLVIITPSRFNEHMNVYNPKSVLSQINQELRNEISNKWVSQVNFVNNATVPVVKVNCHIKDLMIHSNNK